MAPHFSIVLILFALSLENVYAHIQHRRQVDSQTCIQTSTSNFNLLAVYKDAPASSVPIKVIDTNAVPHVGYAILSSCTTCSGSWSYNILQNGKMLPKSTSNPMLSTVSFSLLEGESPSFISTQFPPPGYSGYCTMANLVDPDGPPILGANTRSDLWSLCPNSTASGRVDVVYAPTVNHAHYIKDNCRDVYLEFELLA